MWNDLYQAAKLGLFRLDPEHAHQLTLTGMRAAQRFRLLEPLFHVPEHLHHPVEVMGLEFPNVVGLAAGMDKTGAAVDAFGELGFGHIEVGTVTPRPQSGNPKPRMFRIAELEAIINRMGFNNPGLEGLLKNLAKRNAFKGILGVNIGKNFDTPNERALEDYRACLRGVYEAADYVTVNLSSPNTEGLRDLQEIESCERLIRQLLEERDSLAEEHGVRRSLTLKFSPDLSDDHLIGLAEMCNRVKIDAVIATNTTISKDLVYGYPHAKEAGGLSGGPLGGRSLDCLKLWREHLDEAIPVISVGGILTGADARERLNAGAALVQIYTGLIYRGPDLIRDILQKAAY